MPTVVMLFHDGEIMYARTPPLRLDLPVIEVEVLDPGSNSQQAVVPLSAIRQLIVEETAPARPPERVETWDRAAFHFTDGQVLRAWISPDALLGVYGGIWPVVEPGSEELRTLAIPYSSLKGVFRLRTWDGRGAAARQEPSSGQHGLNQVVRILAEREARAVGHVDPRGPSLLERVREVNGHADAADVAGPERRRDG